MKTNDLLSHHTFIEKFTHPRAVLFLLALPFMFICPFIILSLLTGYPYNVIQNNQKKHDLEVLFNDIPIPANVQPLTVTKSYIGGFDTNTERCDVIVAKVLDSPIDEATLGQQMTTNFSNYFGSNPQAIENYELAYNGQLFVIPINQSDESYDSGLFLIDLTAFGLEDLAIQHRPYLLYLVSYNVFESSDPRCSEPVVVVTPQQPISAAVN